MGQVFLSVQVLSTLKVYFTILCNFISLANRSHSQNKTQFVFCGSCLREPVCPPGLPGPRRQNPPGFRGSSACPHVCEHCEHHRMHGRVLSDKKRVARHGLVRQTSTALVAASLEDLSAVRGSHSLTEAVNLASLSLFRLICSEH